MLKIIQNNRIEAELKALKKKNILELDSSEEKKVREIIKNVREKGDRALLDYTKKFDQVELEADELKVDEKEIEDSYKKVSADYLSAIKEAIRNIADYHERQKLPSVRIESQTKYLSLRTLPIEKVGIYAPGGRASYPSSVLMNAIPAKIAGVEEIVLVSPPPISPSILVAAAELKIKSIYRIGGAQAIAALAFGTQTVPRVDKITGPGNIYVMLAKKILYGTVGIDSLAGPSDVLILADDSANPSFVAADLVAQAEHDPASSSILVSTSIELAHKVQEEVENITEKMERKKIIIRSISDNGRILIAAGMDEAVEISNRIAPEHLEIMTADPDQVLGTIKNAGAVFVGQYTPAVMGDYSAGPNHTLPTGGTARFASLLTVYDFIRYQSIAGYSKEALAKEKNTVITLAEAEGLDAHAAAVEIRLKQPAG